MSYESYRLDNGIRLVHQQSRSLVSHCGLLINVGSRDELPHEHGMAHFIEHVLFKGTKKRKPYHILSRIEDAGGEINAYTTKEETCIHTSFLDADYNRSLELIQDIVFHSVFPAKEIEKEKEVIFDEINSYQDNPAELIFDDFEEMIFPNETIGRNILGDPNSLKSFTRDDISSFMQNNYHTDQMVICSVGNISFKKLVKLFIKYFQEVPSNFRQKDRQPVQYYQQVQQYIEKGTHQVHCLIGNVAYDVKNDQRIGLQLLNNILGGQGLNSRLNLSLREKNGYAYNVESNYNPYYDTGVISIYFGTEKNNLTRSISAVHKEIKKLNNQKLGTLQLSKAKKQLIGQIAISSELHENLMLSIGKSFLIFDHAESLEEIYEKIMSISPMELMDISNEILNLDKLSMLVYQ